MACRASACAALSSAPASLMSESCAVVSRATIGWSTAARPSCSAICSFTFAIIAGVHTSGTACGPATGAGTSAYDGAATANEASARATATSWRERCSTSRRRRPAQRRARRPRAGGCCRALVSARRASSPAGACEALEAREARRGVRSLAGTGVDRLQRDPRQRLRRRRQRWRRLAGRRRRRRRARSSPAKVPVRATMRWAAATA